MINNFLFLVVTFFTVHAYAATSAELMCKSQAKEIAIQTYSNCVTEARNNEIDQIRKSYKEELARLKAKYDQELKQLGTGAAPVKSGKKSAPSVREVKMSPAPKATKGVAHRLPTRTATTAEALPVQGVSEGAQVVPADNPDSSLEKEAADADNNVEVIDLPPATEDVPST